MRVYEHNLRDGAPRPGGPGQRGHAGDLADWWGERWTRAEADKREGVVKARLSNLLAALGELPAEPAPEAPRPGGGLARLIDDICPAGTVVIHTREVPLAGLPLEHLLVCSRGVVVVSPEWAPGPCRPGTTVPVSGQASGLAVGQGRWRSRVVRETLRRAKALRAWMGATAWQGTPVLAAVCSAPTLGPPASPPVLLDGLWLGPVERLPSWLGSGHELDVPSQAALGRFLEAELPIG